SPWSKRTHWGVLFVAVGVWQAASFYGLLPPRILPPPSAILRAWIRMTVANELPIDAFASLTRVIGGFSIASGLAVSLGLVLSMFPQPIRSIENLLELLRPIPPIAWVPLAVLWFGIGNQSAIFIVVVGAFFPIFTSTSAAISTVSANYVNCARCLG